MLRPCRHELAAISNKFFFIIFKIKFDIFMAFFLWNSFLKSILV